MYAKCGAVNNAGLVFHRMKEKNVWTWSAMILGLAQHGSAYKAQAFPVDGKLYCAAQLCHVPRTPLCLQSCWSCGLRVPVIFNDMQVIYGITPRMIHYGAMVDILARAGCLKEPYSFIFNMATEPDPVIWWRLLSACKIHDVHDSEGVGHLVGKKLLKHEPKRGGNLVMVANRYTEVGMFEKAASLRKVMRNVGLKKEAGESSVVVDGALQGFFSG